MRVGSQILRILVAFVLGGCHAFVNEEAPAATISVRTQDVSFYILRIEFTTTSDRAVLEFSNSENILASRLVSVHGNPTKYVARVERLALVQPIRAAEDGRGVGITVDLALSPDALNYPLQFRLRKGQLNGSNARFFAVSGGGEAPLKEGRLLLEIGEEGDFVFDLRKFVSDVPVQHVSVERPDFPRLLLAFYYPWYKMDMWSDPVLKDHPSAPYSSDNPRTIARQIDQAKSAGIDGFICSWWGPGSETDQNLKLLLSIAEQKDFLVTIYFETLALVRVRDGAYDEDRIFKWLQYLISNYGNHPAFMRVYGKPLVVFWASDRVPLEAWKNIFEKLRAREIDGTYLALGYDGKNLDVFDGLHDYGIFPYENLEETYSRAAMTVHYYALFSDLEHDTSHQSAVPKIWVATVQPGYDERALPGRSGNFQDREDGAFYRHTFDAAIKSDPDWIFITTWNEWWEHSHIEPSERYGDLYLQITREYAQKWKGN